MKRLIKFYNKYESYLGKFSTCSTEYEVLPYLLDDNATVKDLRQYVEALGYETIGNCKTNKKTKKWNSDESYNRELTISHFVKLNEFKLKDQSWGETDEKYQWCLGFIQINETDSLSLVENLDGVINQDIFNEIMNNQELAFQNVTEISQDKELHLIVESWGAFHFTELMGYQNFETLLKDLEIPEYTFDDSVSSCGECGEYDWTDNGHTYNFRFVNECEYLGVNCGCFDEYCESNFADEYANEHEKALESELAGKLQKENKIEILETFIGGMVDGRGGYINGQSVREGQPENILSEFQEKYPNTDFLFVHEESGQFQTYFSIAKINNNEDV